MVDDNRAEGTVRDLGGKLQDAVGGLTGDDQAQVLGKVNQVAGQAQTLYGKAADEVRSFAFDQPFVAILSAAGVGLALGILLGFGRR